MNLTKSKCKWNFKLTKKKLHSAVEEEVCLASKFRFSTELHLKYTQKRLNTTTTTTKQPHYFKYKKTETKELQKKCQYLHKLAVKH